jgi:choline-sulfatase
MSNSIKRNVLILMSDEHNAAVAGHEGHTQVRTPNLDRLSTMGTQFRAAYTASPICVPARASFATGLPVSTHRCWDNVLAWKGTPKGWHHELRDRGHRVASIGKLHFAGHHGDDYGLTEALLPMHVQGGTGDAQMLFREASVTRPAGVRLGQEVGPGESEYTLYDRKITSEAQIWLQKIALSSPEKPWVLFVSWVAPHFPLIAPPEHFFRYVDLDIPLPKQWRHGERPNHPYVTHHIRRSCYDEGFKGPEQVKRALAAYFGLTTFMDENVGKILAVLDRTDLWKSTDVLYTSDHGDNLGTRGMWGKSSMYEESARVPMIAVGEGFESGKVIDTPVSHTDVAPWVLNSTGCSEAIHSLKLPGTCLKSIVSGAHAERAVVSEFHTGAPDGFWMLRDKRYKYIHYIGFPDQLFDLVNDPEEQHDLASNDGNSGLLREFKSRLERLVDTVSTNALAHADQEAMIDQLGGRAEIAKRKAMPFTPAPTQNT